MSKSFDSKIHVPVKSTNVPRGGLQKQFPNGMPYHKKVYSSYTGEFVGYGNVLKGTKSDAPRYDPNYRKPFHVIVHNSANDTFMIHRHQSNNNISNKFSCSAVKKQFAVKKSYVDTYNYLNDDDPNNYIKYLLSRKN